MHVRPAAERAEVLVRAVHGPVYAPEAEQVAACVHYRLVYKLQADDALELLRRIMRLCHELLVCRVLLRRIVRLHYTLNDRGTCLLLLLELRRQSLQKILLIKPKAEFHKGN